MKAVIMAGGFGTRLRPITDRIPKPCIPIVGVPCIVRAIRSLAAVGIREFHVTLYYLPEVIQQALSKDEFRDLTIVYHRETVPLGTAGSVKNAMCGCNEDFVVVSGDAVFDFDLSEAFRFHASSGGCVTILSSRVADPGGYGVMLCDERNCVNRFLEKPDPAHSYSDEVNTGIYVCSPSFLDRIPEGVSDFSKDVFPKMLKDGVPVFRYPARGYWCDVGTVSSYLECNRHLLAESGDLWESSFGSDTVVESPCYIGKNVTLTDCHIGPFTVIGDGCSLTGVRAEGCVFHTSVTAQAGVAARNAVVCSNSILRSDVRIGDECVIGADCELGCRSTVPAGVKIYPMNHVPGNGFVLGNLHHNPRNPIPEDGKILFPFGEDFGGAMIYEIGRALAELFGGDVVVGRGEQKDAAATMTFCGGVLSCGKNLYDTGVNDLSRFRFTVRNYAFRCGAYFDRNYSNLILRLFDEGGMPLDSLHAKKLVQLLSVESACGEDGGMYRVFRGGAKSYVSYLRSFGIPSRLKLRVSPSPVLSPLLPRMPEVGATDRMRVGREWLRIERSDGEPYDESLIQLCACVALSKKKSPVLFPDYFPFATESVVERFGFSARRIERGDEEVRKLFPLTDPNVQALLILDYLDREDQSFAEFASQIPSFSVKQRDISVVLSQSSVMRILATSGGALQNGICFFDRGGSVRILPKTSANAFRVISEAANAELAEELCEFYSMKLKGIKPI